MKFKYYKEIEFGKTIRLHLMENNGKYIIGKTFPESWDFFDKRNLVEIENVDEWLDEGLNNCIFDCKPIPNSVSS